MYKVILIFLMMLLVNQACISGDFHDYISLSTTPDRVGAVAISSTVIVNEIVWDHSPITSVTVIPPNV